MYKMFYNPSTSQRHYPVTGQSWGQSAQSRIIGAGAVAAGTSASAGSANRIYSYLRRTRGNDFAIGYFQKATFGPYRLNKTQTALIWN
jgi:hypothetical protein